MVILRKELLTLALWYSIVRDEKMLSCCIPEKKDFISEKVYHEISAGRMRLLL